MKNVIIAVIVLVVLVMAGYMLTNRPMLPAPSVPRTAAVPEPVPAPAPAVSALTPTPAHVPIAPAKPAAKPVPSTPAVTARPATSLTVARMVIAGAIKDRHPVQVGAKFPASQDKVYCYLELTDVPKDQRITFVWTHGGEKDKQAGQIRKAERWRTWSYKVITGKKGDWTVDVLDESGNILRSAAFVVE